VDHFIWYPIASPEAQGKPCNVTVVAIDSFGSYAKFFSGTANLTASRGAAAVPMNPTTPVQFTNGFWSGDITILQSSTNVVLRADDVDGHTGSSNPFDVMLLDDISITMTDSPDPVSTGASLTYTLVVTNIGPAPATNVVVSNTLPNAVAFVSANSTQGTCTQTGSVVTCAIGTLPGGAGATVTIFVTAGVATSSTITNTAAVYRGEPDPVLTNNVATAVTTLFTPLLSVNDVIVVEGNSGTTNAVLSFTLSPPGIVPVSVQFSTANGTAAAGSDYVPTNGTLNFAPGQTLKTVTVVVNGDTASEPSEYLFLNLTSPANALLARTQAVVTIVNDEAAPVAYMRSSVGAPWGSVANETAMNRVFGANNWQDLRYETVIPANVFSPATKFIYMEGSDNNAVELETFLGSNIVTIQNWVSNGGNLFLNAAPNEDNGMSFGFGVTLIYSDFSSTGTASLPSHPIFIGPFTPVGTSWNGNYFGHATVTGTGLLALITSSGNGHIVLGEKSWGNGRVLFGGMTTDNFHSPQPQAPNLRANILAYLSSLAASLDAPPVIQNLTVQGTTMSFSWTSRPGQRYQIYCADDLMGSPWLPLGEEVVATDTTTTFADPNPPSTQRFYRIMEVR
jgi:uncharacterized repeat protein (TIGR01451 family)